MSGLGNDYVVAAYPQYTAVGAGYNLPSLSNITAAYDDTEVTFTMGGLKNSKTTGGLKAGQSKTWKLKAGDVLCFANEGDGEDISGSRIRATKPIAVNSGNQCANVPSGVYACDYTSEMELPTSAWGKEYHVTPVLNRLTNPVIRVFAHPDYKNVKVYLDGKEWFTIPNNSRVENQAFIERRVDYGAPRAAVVSASAPIYIMLYNPGQTDDNIPSDPFQYVLTPIEQYQKEIVFCTPNARGSANPFTRNFVNLVYAVDDGNVIPDDLEFAIVNNGKFEWRRVSSRFGASPGKIFPVKSTNGLQYAVKNLTLPTEGVFRIRAKKPFAAYAYGFSDYDSYGFPTSVAVGDLSKKDTVNPDPQFKVECDGTVTGPDGKLPVVTDMPNDVNVRSNLAIIYMDYDTTESYNYEFSVVDATGKETKIIPGQTIRTFWKLKVIDPSKDARVRLFFIDKAGNDTSIVIQYSAFKATLVENPINFGLLNIGDKRTLTFKAVNNSDSEVEITRFQLKNGSEGFSIFEKDGVTPVVIPFKLTGRSEKEFVVVFSKDIAGDFVDSIGIGNSCAFGYPLEVRAKTGEPIILVTQDADFVQKPVNSTTSLPFTVQNTGSADLIITDFTLPKVPEFVIKYNNVVLTKAMINANRPLILKPSEIASFSVEFTPTAVAKYSDEIYFMSNAKKVDSVELMMGEGIAPGLFAQGHPWEKKRILTNHPYDKALTVTNTGNDDVEISDVVFTQTENNFQFTNDDVSAFKSIFVGQILKPGQTITAPVEFEPQTIGEKELEFEFISKQGLTAKAKLTGTGIIGRIKTENVEFGETKLDDGVRIASEEKEKQVRFEINNDGNYIYGDTVTIQLPFNMNAAEIIPGTKNGNNYGTKGFAYVSTAISTNGIFNSTDNTVKLYNTGDYVEFTAFFNGPAEGVFTTDVTSVSDAERDVTSTLRGTTINIPSGVGILNLSFVNPPIVCINDPSVQVGTVDVLNTGDANLTITGITYNPAIDANSTPWSVKQDYAPAYFTLTPTNTADDKRTLEYNFKAPSTAGSYTVDVTVASNAAQNATQTVTLTGQTVAYSGSLNINGTSGKLEYGKEYTYTVGLSTPTVPSVANVNKMTITMSYPSQMFVYRGAQSLNPAWQIDGTPTVQNGLLTIQMSSTSATPIAAGTDIPYISVTFYTVLSSDPSFVQAGKGTIEAKADANSCFPIASTSINVAPPDVCFAAGRATGGSGLAQGNMVISPNPVQSMGGTVNFSVGIQSSTTLTVYSSTGEEVVTMALGVLQPGEYVATLPMDKLSSGNYTVKFVSGPFTEVKPFAVTK